MFFFDTITRDDLTKISLVASFVSIPLGIYRHVASWYVMIAISALNIVIYALHGDYTQMGTRVFTIIMNCYGAYKWSTWGTQHTQRVEKKITKTNGRTWQLLGIYIVLVGIVFFGMNIGIEGYLGNKPMKEEYIHFAFSGFFGSCTLAGQWMSAHKKLESNLFWLGMNMLGILYHYHELDSLFWIKNLVYIPCSIYGYKLWHSKYKKEQKN